MVLLLGPANNFLRISRCVHATTFSLDLLICMTNTANVAAFILIYVIYLIVALTGQAIYSRALGEYPIAEQQVNAGGQPTDEKQE